MRRIVAAAGFLALTLPGCMSQSQRDPTGTTTKGFYAPAFETVWEATETTLRRHGFTPNPEESSKSTKIVVSRWNTQLHPFSHKGIRTQATVYLREVEGRPNYWATEVNVVKQTNINLKEPSNPIRAQWAHDERVTETEARITHDIEVFFLGYDVSPEFRASYGMGAGRRDVPAPPPTGGAPPPPPPPSTTK